MDYQKGPISLSLLLKTDQEELLDLSYIKNNVEKLLKSTF